MDKMWKMVQIESEYWWRVCRIFYFCVEAAYEYGRKKRKLSTSIMTATLNTDFQPYLVYIEFEQWETSCKQCTTCLW